jgi:hypothetical protein
LQYLQLAKCLGAAVCENWTEGHELAPTTMKGCTK